MKKALILLLLLLCSLAFTACGGENDPGEEPGNSDQGSSGNDQGSDGSDQGSSGNDQGSSGNDQGSGNTDQGSNDNNQENDKPDEEELITPPGTYITDTEIGNDLEIKADFWEVSWEEVPGATEYIVCVNENEYRTEECGFLLFEYLSPSETVKLSVTPVTESGNDESLRSGIYYTTEEVTEGLSFKKLKDGSYAVYCPADKLPENGELVLPDSYDGCDVTEFRNPENKTPGLGDSLLAASGEKSDYVGPELSEISKVRLSSNLTTIGIGVLYKSAIKEIYIPEFVDFIS